MGTLTIAAGSPNWWLSPSIWVTPVGSPTSPPGTGNPIAGDAYNVSVRVSNPYPDPVDSGSWDLFVCWAIPTSGPIPTPAAASGQILNNAALAVPVPAMSSVVVQTAMTWTPSFENGGHECLVAAVYSLSAGLGLPSSLNGNPSTQDTERGTISIAQHNLAVLPVLSGMGMGIRYPFQVCNGFDEERGFVIRAQQAPLSEIAHFLPGVPGGRAVADRPGKVERLGIVASAKPDSRELEAASAVLSRIRIARRSCRAFMLVGNLESGNALINITQSLDERVVGGLSVLVMAEAK